MERVPRSILFGACGDNLANAQAIISSDDPKPNTYFDPLSQWINDITQIPSKCYGGILWCKLGRRT
eukprot:1283956-Karenia_brevis.AAC.1